MCKRIKLIRFLLVCLPIPLGCTSPDKPISDPYMALYISLGKVSEISPNEVAEVGHTKVYPTTIEKVWKATLYILGQYDQVLCASSDKRLIIVSQHTPLANLEGRQGQAYDISVVLAVLVRPLAGGAGAAVSIAWLPPETLEPAPIPDYSSSQLVDKHSLSLTEARQLVTYSLAHRFHIQLATQLFGPEDWEKKFTSKKVE
jgi:hypothetical protein